VSRRDVLAAHACLFGRDVLVAHLHMRPSTGSSRRAIEVRADEGLELQVHPSMASPSPLCRASRESSAGWAVPPAPASNGSSRTGVHWSASACTWLGTQAWVAGVLLCKETPESRAEAEPCSRPSSYVGENGLQPVGEPAWETERYPARKVSAADKAALSPARQVPSRELQQLAEHTGV
jgi:hypothetical protein